MLFFLYLIDAHRIKEVLEGVQSVLMQRVPDLKAVMKVRIINFFLHFCSS